MFLLVIFERGAFGVLAMVMDIEYAQVAFGEHD
jgi:hypothetical protein